MQLKEYLNVSVFQASYKLTTHMHTHTKKKPFLIQVKNKKKTTLFPGD